MACRSVNSLRLSKDDMRRVYREQARKRRGGVTIGHITEVLDVLVPLIPHFFGQARVNANVDADSYYRCNMGYAGEDDMPFHRDRGRYGIGMASRDDIGSDHYGFGMGDVVDRGHYGHDMSYGNASGRAHYGMSHVDDYGDRVISEEEFERLLDYVEQRNVRMY